MSKKPFVKFVRGSEASWQALQNTPEKIDNDTLYFIYQDAQSSNKGNLYLGQKPIIGNEGVVDININNIGGINIDGENLEDKQILYYDSENEEWKNGDVDEIIDVYSKNEIDELLEENQTIIKVPALPGFSPTNDFFKVGQWLVSAWPYGGGYDYEANISLYKIIEIIDHENDDYPSEFRYEYRLTRDSRTFLSGSSLSRLDYASKYYIKNFYYYDRIDIFPNDLNFYDNDGFYKCSSVDATIVDNSFDAAIVNNNKKIWYQVQWDKIINLRNKIFYQKPEVFLESYQKSLYQINDIFIFDGSIFILQDIQNNNNAIELSFIRNNKIFNNENTPPTTESETLYINTYQKGDIYIQTDSNNNNIFKKFYKCVNVAKSKVFLYNFPHYIYEYTWEELKINKDTLEGYGITDAYTKSEVDSFLNNKEDISNKVISLSASSTNTEYPSAKAVYDAIDNISLTPGPRGIDGKSAYEVAVENGYQGTEQQWLASLVGAQGPQGIQGETGPQGATGQTGADGKSAYEVAVDNGFVGTEQQWLTSLVGQTGATGAQGPAGVNGADWVPTQQELNDIAARVINLLPYSFGIDNNGVYIEGSIEINE